MLLDEPERLVELGNADAREMARPHAARQIVDLIEGVAGL